MMFVALYSSSLARFMKLHVSQGIKTVRKPISCSRSAIYCQKNQQGTCTDGLGSGSCVDCCKNLPAKKLSKHKANTTAPGSGEFNFMVATFVRVALLFRCTTTGGCVVGTATCSATALQLMCTDNGCVEEDGRGQSRYAGELEPELVRFGLSGGTGWRVAMHCDGAHLYNGGSSTTDISHDVVQMFKN